MLKTHALPPLSYAVPDALRGSVAIGSVVVVPLSGRGRLGVVVSRDESPDLATEEVRATAGFTLTPEIVELCERVAKDTSSPLAAILACALPPGISTGYYRTNRKIGQNLQARERISRRKLKEAAGGDRLKKLEERGYIVLDPTLPNTPSEEVAVAAFSPDSERLEELGRAPVQRRMMEAVNRNGGSQRTSELLKKDGFRRETLRTLVRRGFVLLEERPRAEFDGSMLTATGEDAPKQARKTGKSSEITPGEMSLRRVPSGEMPNEVAVAGASVLESGKTLLVLAPEVSVVEEVAQKLRRSLPSGVRTGVYHGGFGDGRAEVWRAASAGELDVLVGTRPAAMFPMKGLGGVIVVDEPNPSFRAASGYEGVPAHVRGILAHRSRIEGCGVLFLSPHPSLRLYAAALSDKVRELPVRNHERWPRIRLVDTRGTGAYFSRTCLDACRNAIERDLEVGVVVERTLSSSRSICAGCGTVRNCESCDAPLPAPNGKSPRIETVRCPRCRTKNEGDAPCRKCGSTRMTASGMSVERVASLLSEKLGIPVGTTTAGGSTAGNAEVIVGTPAKVLARNRDIIIVPDSDALLHGRWLGASERAFRVLVRAAESAKNLLIVQSRDPENETLRAAVRGDYRTFASRELPRLEALGYPPFGHLARLSLRGSEPSVRRAVESGAVLAGGFGESGGVESSGLVAGANPADREDWLVLLRSPSKESVASVAAHIAKAATKEPGQRRVRVTVEIDPEEM